jgi:phage terminase large subunit
VYPYDSSWRLVTRLVIPTARVFQPLFQQGLRYLGAKGGRGSAKSHFLVDLAIDQCIDRDMRIVCIREVQRTLSQSVKQLLQDKIISHGAGYRFRVLKPYIEVGETGRIAFEGMQNHTAESIKSLEAYDVALIEEAQSLSQRSLDLLRPTLRKPGSQIWAAWNPNDPKDPIDALLVKDPPPRAVTVHSNWQDNPWFPEDLRDDMEYDRRRDPDKYDHIWGGAYRNASEAQVFKNWEIRDFDTPDDAQFYLGADWGFSVDPSVLIRCFVVDRTLFVDYEAYQVGCEIDNLPALFAGTDDRDPPRWPNPKGSPGVPGATKWVIRADSARPETISYMNRRGFRMFPAKKGAGSVVEGVEFLKSYDIVVHPRCVHTADELKFYSFMKDRLTDEVIPVLADKKNHVIDSLRYAVENVRRSGGARIS